MFFSDIPETPADSKALLSALQHLKFNKHEVIFMHVVYGQKELQFDFENRPYQLEDPETGEKVQLNPERYKQVYLKELQAYQAFLKQEMQHNEIDMVTCDMNKSPEEVLSTYLVKRNKMM